jgi:hypothetical protein
MTSLSCAPMAASEGLERAREPNILDALFLELSVTGSAGWGRGGRGVYRRLCGGYGACLGA